MNRAMRYGILLCVFSVMAVLPAHAEVTVSVTINGSLDEIIPILELLRDMGIGSETLGQPGDPLRLNIHSVSTVEPEAGSFEAVRPAPVDLQNAAPETAEPPLELGDLQFAPSPAQPDTDVLMTVGLRDSENQVDTVVATVRGLHNDSFDLYDNGTHGDATANDNIWSATFHVPADARPGEYGATVTAFDPHGDPVQAPSDNGETIPLIVQGALTVAK